MGLDTTHDCWHGSYSAFNRWRCHVAEAVGIPLALMEGYEDYGLIGDVLKMCRRHLEFRDRSERGGLAFLGQTLVNMARCLPIRWDVLKPDMLHVLLNHSDCDGFIPAELCGPLADRLTEILPLLPVDGGGWQISTWRETTQQFIDGLRLAADLGERVEFH